MNLYSLSKAAAEHTGSGRRGLPAQSDERRHTPVTGVQVPGMIFQIMRKAQANELILKDPVKLADKTRHAPRKSRKDSLHQKDSKKQFNSTEEVAATTVPTAVPMQYSSCNRVAAARIIARILLAYATKKS